MSRMLADRQQALVMLPMQVDDIDQVLAIENVAYTHPWTRGNFLDSIRSNYQTIVLRDASYQVIGYFLMMPAVDEAHLLNITVRPDLQGIGLGRMLLDKAVALARERKMASMLLEVRPSNQRALEVYKRYGFERIGQRKGYYPATNGREDAIVMRMAL